MEDEISKIINRIKKICQNVDSTNSNEVDICLCDIIDLCNKLK